MIFHSHANKNHFHNKGFALSLVLKARVFGTRKWPRQVSQKTIFLQLAGARRFVGKIISHLPDLLLTQSIFLNGFFPFYVIMFLCVEGSDNYNFLLIHRLFCIEFSVITRFAYFLPTVLKTWTPCKYCK